MFTYLTRKLWDGIFGFVRHLYVDGFRVVAGITIEFLSALDGTFAVKINLRFLFTPLYQDRSFIGYVLGFLFRTFRVLIGGAVYLVIALFAAGAYVAWAAVPIFLVYKIITSAI